NKMSEVSEALQKEWARFVEQENGKGKINGAVHELTNRCWDTCIKSTSTNALDGREKACLQNCVERFLDVTTHTIRRMQNSKA
ncbi:Mitochondrial import inner membrane translocase subunit tim8, partial [Coemansia sp. Benny D160-2]